MVLLHDFGWSQTKNGHKVVPNVNQHQTIPNQKPHRGSKACARVVKSNYREADLGGTKLGPRMGVGILGLLRIPLLLGSAFLLSSGLSLTSSSIGLHACCR